jgi:NADH-quinone oxidoreductase subunit N
MNALILSAVLGVVMMFSGIVLKQKGAILNVAIAGLIALLAVNVLEMSGTVLFDIDAKGMLAFDRFALLFNTVAFIYTIL